MIDQLRTFIALVTPVFHEDTLRFSEKTTLVTFVNPFSYLHFKRNATFRKILPAFDYIYSDGILLTILALIFCKKYVQRYSFDGNSLAPKIFRYLEKKDIDIALIGGEHGITDGAREILRKKYLINFSIISPGFFKDTNEKHALIKKIAEKKIQVIILGMGCPYQEELAVQFRERGFKGIVFTCGGYFEQIVAADNEVYYPDTVNKYNLRWLYRIVKEPRKMIKRYTVDYFPMLVDSIKRS